MKHIANITSTTAKRDKIMKTDQLTALLSGALGRAKTRRGNKKIRMSYLLDFDNKTVSITETDLVFKDVIVSGHIGTGSRWKSKRWTETGEPKRIIFTGNARQALAFLDSL